MSDDRLPSPRTQTPRTTGAWRIGCVSYLNARPLIENLDDRDDLSVRFDVPSRLLDDLHTRRVDIALCPVIDYFASALPLIIVPAGGIGCDGQTLTVRIFSKVPIGELTEIHADTDSHTSVALMRILLAEQFATQPRIIAYHAREHVAEHRLVERPQAMLLIGDKVVTDSPRAVEYPHQLDLGQAWRDLTGLPFVFAVWMALRDTPMPTLRAVYEQLDQQRRVNQPAIAEIAARHAEAHGWPVELAHHYLGTLLQYAIGARQIQAMQRFGELAHKHGLIDEARTIELSHAND